MKFCQNMMLKDKSFWFDKKKFGKELGSQIKFCTKQVIS